MKIWICLTLFFGGLVLQAQHTGMLKDSIPKWLAQSRVPAAGVAVIKGGKVEWANVFGERTTGAKATRDTIFNVASLTKPVFAMMALHLVARGELDLDESLSPYWIDPDLLGDERHRKLTARIILSHQTGFPNWRRDKKLAFAFDPGTKYQYSGEGMEYLKRAIERKTKKSMPELTKALVFDPAGMKSTSFTWKEEAADRFAVGFDAGLKAYQIPKRTDPSAADDLLTTIDDYARFLAWVANGAGLPKPLAEEMQRPQVKNSTGSNFGLGWQLMQGKTRALMHGGSDEGVRTEAIVSLDTRAGIVVLTNSDNGELVIQRVFEEALGESSAMLLTLAIDDWKMLEGLSSKDLGPLVDRFATSPSMEHRLLRAMAARFVAPSGLRQAEKDDARQTFHALITGMISGQVPKEAVLKINGLILQPMPNGVRLIGNPSDEDLRTVINAVKRATQAEGK